MAPAPAGVPARTTRVRPSPKPDLTGVERSVHELIAALGPELRRQRHWGHDWYVGRDLVAVVGRFRAHVGVEFWRGRELAAAHPVLEGTGKELRHVQLRDAASARSPEFADLVREAVELDGATEPRARSPLRAAARSGNGRTRPSRPRTGPRSRRRPSPG